MAMATANSEAGSRIEAQDRHAPCTSWAAAGSRKAAKEACVIDTVVPCESIATFTRASSCRARASIIVVPRPGFGLSEWLVGFPMPSSETESLQFGPATSYATFTVPPARSPGNACLKALMTSSVTMRPRLTAWLDEVVPSWTWTCKEIGRRSPIIDAARVSHSRVR